MARTRWTPQQTLAAFDLYLRTPFGRQHERNLEIVALAAAIGRTPGAVSMKLSNFSGLDPTEKARGIKGLKNRSKADAELFALYLDDPESIAVSAGEAFDAVSDASNNAAETSPPSDGRGDAQSIVDRPDLSPEQTEREAIVRVRRVQRSFRGAVLASYEGRCAVTGCEVGTLLVASHIIPWSVAGRRRADPRNDLCLNVLHDRAFDRGLITFDDQLRVLVSPALPDDETFAALADQFTTLAGQPLYPPSRFGPTEDVLAHHRELVFIS